MKDYLESELEKLRDQYISSHPAQRATTIKKRLDDPKALPNQLVTRVAAVEALSRSLLMNQNAHTITVLKEIYPKFRYRKVTGMIAELLKIKKAGTPSSFFGKDDWHIFKIAVKYRNLLVHECTYLGRKKYQPLEKASNAIYEKLLHFAE